MTQIEQAIFTSARTPRFDGYQLVVASPGVSTQEACELARWGPTHDSLWDDSPNGASVNFRQLQTGTYCLSWTTRGGAEYSRRGGDRIHTHCWLVPPEVFHRFCGNPLKLFDAISANTGLHATDDIPKTLEPLTLVGRASAVDSWLLQPWKDNDESRRLVVLLEAVLDAMLHDDILAVATGRDGILLCRQLLNLLPISLRESFSFSTGLRFSPRRPYRLNLLANDPLQNRRVSRQTGTPVLALECVPVDALSLRHKWAQNVFASLRMGDATPLVDSLSAEHSNAYVAQS